MIRDDEHDHDQGLQGDLRRMNSILSRRQIMRLIAGASLIPLIACGSDSKTQDAGSEATGNTDGTAGTGTTTATGDVIDTPATCSTIPEETAGPYPGDGSNGPNALGLSDIVRQDIRSSVGTLSGTASGVPLTVRLKLVNGKSSCASLAGFAIYLWHCDKDGKYSMYNITTQNYLRGVQETDVDGMVSFTTIFPGCYDGRMPHMHFEVYPSIAKATASGNKVKTSQLAFPRDICNEVYATSGYSTSVSNFSRITFASDNVFSDGVTLQLASMSGSVQDGLVADLIVTISA